MSDLGRLLEAIHNSRSNWRTLRAEYRIWIHRPRQAAAWDADIEESDATSYATLVGEDDEPDEAEGLWRVWIEKPDRMRQETEGGVGSETTSVVVGNTWWMWNELSGARTNEGHEEISGGGVKHGAWLEPAKVLGSLSFEAPEEVTIAGRQALRTQARRPAASGLDEEQMTWDLHSLGGVADEYLLDVDQERGILLRVECRFRNEPFLIGEVTDVAFDEEFGPEIFVLEPPDGSEIELAEPLRDRRHFRETITEAAAAAPFPIFILPSVPDEWSTRVWTTPPQDRPPLPYTVSIHYEADDGTSGLSITNFPAGESDIEVFLGGGPPFEDIECDGIRMRARSRGDDWPDTTVYLTRGDTDLRLMSSTLGGEQVIDAAARLVQAPTSLPQF